MLELPTLVHILALGSRSDRFTPRACKKTDSWYPLLAFISNTACLFYKYIKHRVSILQIYQTPHVYSTKISNIARLFYKYIKHWVSIQKKYINYTMSTSNVIDYYYSYHIIVSGTIEEITHIEELSIQLSGLDEFSMYRLFLVFVKLMALSFNNMVPTSLLPTTMLL